MAEQAVKLTHRSTGQLAGELRRNCEPATLLDFEVHSVQPSAVARADALALLKGITPNGPVEGEFQIVAFRYTDSGDVAIPTGLGRWPVQQGCVLDLLHGQQFSKWQVQWA